MNDFDRIVGLKYLRGVHLNDSKGIFCLSFLFAVLQCFSLAFFSSGVRIKS